jgi:competence protein ComEC
VGFQLGYIALFFIIWLQPLLASMESKNKPLQYIWGILTVSFAAQIDHAFTVFITFPGLFFITLNRYPITGLIMILGVLVVGIVLLTSFHFFSLNHWNGASIISTRLIR